MNYRALYCSHCSLFPYLSVCDTFNCYSVSVLTRRHSVSFLITKHINFDSILCFHMATDLIPGKEFPLLNSSAGKIIAFKSTRFDLHLLPHPTTNLRATAARSSATHLDLYNIKNDIILRITIRFGQNKVFFNDRADKSLLDGWGQEKSVDLNPVDVERWKRLGVTISVYDPYPRAHSKEQYQILFDLTTVFYFDKRFPEPAIKMGYSLTAEYQHLSVPLKFFCYGLDDLPLVERQAIESGK